MNCKESDGYFQCHTDCNGCTAKNNPNLCLSCMDTNKYLLYNGASITGSCVSSTSCNFLLSPNNICLMSTPAGMYCNPSTKQCFTCDPSCGSCAGNNDNNKCTSCADPNSFVMAFSTTKYGSCVPKAACVIPKYRDEPARMCYIDACPPGITCQQCSIACDGCYKSNAIDGCIRCALRSQIMQYETGKCIPSSQCVSPMYRDDNLRICYKSISNIVIN